MNHLDQRPTQFDQRYKILICASIFWFQALISQWVSESYFLDALMLISILWFQVFSERVSQGCKWCKWCKNYDTWSAFNSIPSFSIACVVIVMNRKRRRKISKMHGWPAETGWMWGLQNLPSQKRQTSSTPTPQPTDQRWSEEHFLTFRQIPRILGIFLCTWKQTFFFFCRFLSIAISTNSWQIQFVSQSLASSICQQLFQSSQGDWNKNFSCWPAISRI